MPTRYGFVFLGMLMALLVGSINHNNNLGYLLTFFLGSLLVTSVFFTYRNLTCIAVRGKDARPVFAGQLCRLPIIVESVMDAKYGLSFSLHGNRSHTEEILHGEKTEIEVSCPSERRGVQRFSSLSVASRYPLGLVEIRTVIPVELACLIYARPVPSPFIREDEEGENTGKSRQKKRETGDFTGLDPYSPGDSLKKIHWKGLAGGRGLHSIRFDGDESASAVFSLHNLAGLDVEEKLSKLTFMILAAEAEGQTYGLRLGEYLIPPSKGEAHKNKCLRAIAQYE